MNGMNNKMSISLVVSVAGIFIVWRNSRRTGRFWSH